MIKGYEYEIKPKPYTGTWIVGYTVGGEFVPVIEKPTKFDAEQWIKENVQQN
jgi:hypothetical protein